MHKSILYLSLIFFFCFFVGCTNQASEKSVSSAAEDTILRDSAYYARLKLLASGEKIFKESGCNTCHSVCEKRVGPMLQGISKRRKTEWIHQFVRNSAKLIESGDKDALALYNQYNKMQMPNHEFLNSQDIDLIITYLDYTDCGSE